ncbi:MAG: hypothetical protein EXS59_00785 [Candidatus Taylorbacteria bacterium]|nr:hypothetical protein [Candidatus Taylorbacteria bacterium]
MSAYIKLAINLTGWGIYKHVIAIRNISGAHHKIMKYNDFSFGVSHDTRRPDKFGRADNKALGVFRSFFQKCG